MENLTLEAFEEASEIVKNVTKETKLVYSGHFSAQTGNKVYLKPENMQQTGAYKVRGAYYKISTMDEDARAKGLITASAGNHAQGVAFAAKLTGVAATVCMPTMTPLMKINRTKALGANVVLSGEVFDDACARAYEIAAETGATFVHPFDDLDVATGQGTIAMEIIKELPTVDYILVPIGGGGLCCGVATLAKMLNPKIRVIGVEPENAACMKASLEAGHVVTLPSANTIADGTAVKRPGEKIFPYIQENVESIITIKDDELIVAFLDMVENHKMIVENSGLLTVAARRELRTPYCGGAEAPRREKQEDRQHSERRQHGRHHHGVPDPAWPYHAGPHLHRIRPASGQTGPAGKGVLHSCGGKRKRHQAGAQPVREHQPQCCCGAPDHH